MRCRRVEQLLSLHLDGRLPKRRAAALAAHLDACPACRRRRAEFAALGNDLRAVSVCLRGDPAAPSAASDVALRDADLHGSPDRACPPGLARRAIAHFATQDRRPVTSHGGSNLIRRLAAAGLAGATIAAALLLWPRSRVPAGVTGVAPVGRVAEGGPVPDETGAGRLKGIDKLNGHASAGNPAKVFAAGTAQSRPAPTKDGVRAGGLRAFPAAVLTAGLRPALSANAYRPPAAWTSRSASDLARHASDLDYLNPTPAGASPTFGSPSPGRSSAHENRSPVVPRGDDFVSIPLPRIAAGGPGADWTAAQAMAAYEREAAVVDGRLARKVSLAVKATALSEVCDRLRADMGIHLETGRSVADEKVTVFCREAPLRDLMRQLSRPFGYTWLRSGKQGEYRYELVQDLRSQLLEEELRNRDRNAALLALDDEMNEYRKYLDLSPDEALARARTAPPEERRRLERLATTGWGPARLYFRISPEDLARLRAGHRVTYSAAPWADDDEQPLPPDLARGGLQALRDARVVLRDKGFQVGDAQSAPEGTPPAALPEARAKFTLQLDQSDLGQFTLVGGTGISISTRGHQHWLNEENLAIGESPAVRNPQNAVTNAALARDPALQPHLSVRPQTVANLSPGPSPARGGEREGTDQGTRVTSADVLESIHRATGVNITADYYTRLFPISAVTVGDRTLFDALNHVADAMRLRWTKDGSWLQFRSTSFFHDRLKEVPNRLLMRWAASRREHGTLTLDDLIEIGQLSDAQLDATTMAEGARVLFGLAEWGVARNHGLRPHLRFLAGLTPPQRQEALSARGLLFRRMTLPQQQGFLALCFGAGNRHPQGATLQPGLDELSEATLRTDYMLPGGFRWTAPEVPGDGTPPWLRLSPVREPTREGALQAAHRIDPRATEAQIAPTELQLTVVYTPGGPGSRFAPGGISATPTRTSNSFAFRQRPQ